MDLLNRTERAMERPTAEFLCRAGFLLLVVSFLILSGCGPKTKLVRLSGPEELISGALGEVEAALTGEGVAPESGKVVPSRPRKMGKLEKEVSKLEAKHAKILGKVGVLNARHDALAKKFEKARWDLEQMQNKANELEMLGEKSKDEVMKIVKKAGEISRDSYKVQRAREKLGPKVFRARYKLKKVGDKLKKARDAVDEAQALVEGQE